MLDHSNNIDLPLAPKIATQITIHNQVLKDDYSWLRSEGWPDNVQDKEVLDYLTKENNYFESQINLVAGLKNEIFEELKGRIKLDDQSTYVKKDDFYYYHRMEKDQDYPIYCRKHGSIEAKEEVILDVNELSKGQKFTSIGGFSVSPDHQLLAFACDYTGGEQYIIKVLDLNKKTYLVDQISQTIGNIVWHEKGHGFFYLPVSENWRHDTIKFHKLGDDKPEDDKIIFHEPDPLYSVSVNKTSSKDYILINVGGHDNNEVYYIDNLDQQMIAKLIEPRKEGILYSVDHDGEFFYMHSNYLAKNFQILKTKDLSGKWDIWIPNNPEEYLANFDITKHYLLLNYQHQGLPHLVVYDQKKDQQKSVNFPDAVYTASIYSTNFEEDDIRINYSSFTRSGNVYNYDFSQGKLNLIKEQEIPTGLNAEDYEIERIFAESLEGVKVPISLFYKKSLFKKDGTNPLYLYGYGSYGFAIPPSFRNSAISLANRGFVFAIAHIRGGSELGHDWYEAAKFLNKKRTFADFIASAETLISQKYTSKGEIAIAGGSAGGMLIGNVINQRPELYKLAIAHVPFVDVLNTMLDESLPLTPGEFKEWGNPKEKIYFEYIKSYSPYDNVTKQKYPHLFVTAGLSDPRVGYWEPAKWVAKLRDQKTDENLIIYKTNMDFGHRGASGRFEYLKETAQEIAFTLKIFEKDK